MEGKKTYFKKGLRQEIKMKISIIEYADLPNLEVNNFSKKNNYSNFNNSYLNIILCFFVLYL